MYMYVHYMDDRPVSASGTCMSVVFFFYIKIMAKHNEEYFVWCFPGEIPAHGRG